MFAKCHFKFLLHQSSSEIVSLPYSLLLDYSTFEFTTLPYPTRSWKTTTRWGLPKTSSLEWNWATTNPTRQCHNMPEHTHHVPWHFCFNSCKAGEVCRACKCKPPLPPHCQCDPGQLVWFWLIIKLSSTMVPPWWDGPTESNCLD